MILRRSEIAGGAPLVLCDAAGLLDTGGNWDREGIHSGRRQVCA